MVGAALLAAGCLDVTPSVVVRVRGDKPREQQCLACLEANPGPGPGCGPEIAGCRAEPACNSELECSFRIGHCYGGTRDDLAVCAQECLKNGYFMSGADPALLASSRFYDCIVKGSCSEACFGQVDVSDAGTRDASPTPPPLPEGGDGGGACLGDADVAILAQGVGDTPKACGTQCFATTDPTCSATCVAKKTGLSAGCSSCWGDVINCGIEKCLSPCLVGGQACTDCTAQKCDPAFHVCSGT